MPDVQQWEYCELILFDVQRSRNGTLYELGIRYFGAGSRMLSRAKGKLAREWGYDPWEAAIGLLGRGGWEMVSVQHANTAGDMGGGGEVGHGNAVAYFKRPVVPGRAVDEPAVELE